MIIKPPQNLIHGLSKLARNHPRYQGCTIHYALFEEAGAVAYNLADPHLYTGTINGTVAWDKCEEGTCLAGDGTTWIDTGYAADQTARSWSLMMRFIASSANTGDFGVFGAFDFTGTAPDPYFSVGISTDTPNIQVASRDTVGSTDVDSAGLSVDVFDDIVHTMVGVYDTATAAIRIYVDGVGASGAITTNSNESKNLTAANIGIMATNFNTGPGTPPIMSLLEARWYQDRVLTDAEARSFSSRPYLEYEWAYQHRRRIWTVGAGGEPIGPSIGSLTLMGVGR